MLPVVPSTLPSPLPHLLNPSRYDLVPTTTTNKTFSMMDGRTVQRRGRREQFQAHSPSLLISSWPRGFKLIRIDYPLWRPPPCLTARSLAISRRIFKMERGISSNKLKDLVSQAEAAHVGSEGVSNPRNLPWGERARRGMPSPPTTHMVAVRTM